MSMHRRLKAILQGYIKADSVRLAVEDKMERLMLNTKEHAGLPVSFQTESAKLVFGVYKD